MHHHSHPYGIQTAALFVALLPFVLLFTLMIGARFFEKARRARKPAHARPAADIAIPTSRALLTNVE